MESNSSLIRLKAKLKQPARHCFVVLFAFATMGLMALLALNLSFLSPVAQVMRNFSLTDIYYHILKDTGSSEPSHVITIVDMTDIMDRDALASVIEDIEECRPKVLAVDMLFSGERDDSIGNAHLIRVAQQYPNIVYSYKLGDYVDDSVGYTSEQHSFFTDEVSVKEGFTNFERTLYGAMKRSVSVRRRVNGEVRNSLALQVADIYADGKLEKVEADDYHINFCPRTYHVIPADSILQHRQWVENRIVLFGAMHEQIDTHTTPLGDIPGVELIAYSIQTMLEQAEVRHPSVLFTIVFWWESASSFSIPPTSVSTWAGPWRPYLSWEVPTSFSDSPSGIVLVALIGSKKRLNKYVLDHEKKGDTIHPYGSMPDWSLFAKIQSGKCYGKGDARECRVASPSAPATRGSDIKKHVEPGL